MILLYHSEINQADIKEDFAMNRLPDMHLHTRFSSDSEARPEDVVKKAMDMKLRAICFTDHNDFDWPEEEDGKPLFLLDFPSYLEYMKKLRADYEGIFPIYIGVEQGLGKGCAKRVDSYDADGELDFIIGSSHLVHGQDPYYESFWVNRDIARSIDDYYESIIDNIKSCSNYDVYGHLDYIARYIPDKSYRYDIHDYMDIIETILKMLIERGKGIELNTAGLKYGMDAPNPDISVLKLYRQLGGEIITVGSDAHKAEDVAKYHDIAYELLKESGFRYYTIFEKRKPVFEILK